MNASTAELLAHPRREVVEVRGPDARSFLQSLLSQDLAAVQPGQGVRALLLEPQGKLRAATRVLCCDDETFWCDTDIGWGSALVDGLLRFRIRVKVDITLRPDLGVLEVRGAGADAVVGAAGYPLPGPEAYAHVAPAELRVVRAPWPGLDGLDIVVAASAIDEVAERLHSAGAASADDDRTETLRVLHGVVRQGADIDESTIAQEAHLEVDAVSFTKGCFVGQELVCRIDSRGHVNRFVRRLVVDDPAARLRVGDDVVADDRVVGAVTSAAPSAPAALAIVRREVEPGATVLVGDVKAIVEAIG